MVNDIFSKDPKEILKAGFSSREVIEIQSRFFYGDSNFSSELGFETQAELEKEYPNQIFKLINDLVSFNVKSSFNILELGGGTGKFCKEITNLLDINGIKYSYTIVDVVLTKYDDLKKNKNIKLIKKSFDDFSHKCKNQYDILVMNEALDMWAGKDTLKELWEEKISILKPIWIVVDKIDNIIKKKDVYKIKTQDIKKYIWKLVYLDGENNKILNPDTIKNYRYKIEIPELFYTLLRKINLFSVIHDYWSFSNDSNQLRVQQINLDKENDKEFSWVTQNVVPFGSVDVTYSPDQTEFLDEIMETNIQLSNLVFENKNIYDDSIYKIAEKNKETFLLYSEKVFLEISGWGVHL